ncbi:helix-turn-helix domain-containing protein [Nocardioides sp. CCNWLW239]|uniref:helix-turn-helix domain-containing protein n=1 Tax=Nocardioides sp. CCNWLW239 TaxID=3128902 RepID=UPI0030184162
MSENSPAVETVDPADQDEPVVTGEVPDVDVVEVRRNGRLALVVALASLLVGVAFVLRGGIEGYLVGLILLAVAAVQGWTAWDSRMPLLLVDEQGVRLRFGQTWQGIPWSKIESVEHTPRPDGIERFWKDGRIGVLLHDEDEVLAELSPTARRQAMLTERLYGLPFSLPLGLSTRVLGAGDDLTEAIAVVAADGVEVVEIDPALAAEEPEPEADETTAETTDESTDEIVGGGPSDDGDTAIRPPLSGQGGDTNPRMLRVLDEPDINAADVEDEAGQDQVDRDTETTGATSSEGVTARSAEQDETTPTTEPAPKAKAEPVAPLREPSTAVRVDVRYVPPEPQETVAVHGGDSVLLNPAPFGTAADAVEAPEEDEVEGVTLTDPDEPVDAVSTDDADDQPTKLVSHDAPQIGAEISAARRRLALDIDGLAEWTRIRPHVIEAIEVDDFGPCGGDFYARGHLRTLARVLGIEVAPLLRTYDEKYASGPVSPRAVFEAELAHSAAVRPVRRMRGGPSWSVLVAAVMAVILVWSVARLVIDGTQREPEAGAIQLDGSAGTDNPYGKSAPVAVTISAAGGEAHVVVRDSRGKVVFSGDLAFGESKQLQVTPPLRVQTSDGSLKVAVGEGKANALGKTGEAAQRTYTAG